LRRFIFEGSDPRLQKGELASFRCFDLADGHHSLLLLVHQAAEFLAVDNADAVELAVIVIGINPKAGRHLGTRAEHGGVGAKKTRRWADQIMAQWRGQLGGRRGAFWGERGHGGAKEEMARECPTAASGGEERVV